MSKTVPRQTRPRPAYHHGDLRRALVDAGIAILGETQRWDFSLREVARRAGVSHNAPYSHFADKRALLGAIAIEGYNALRTAMLEAAREARTAPEELRAIGAAYTGFGIANPAYYRLMFGQELKCPGDLLNEVLAAAEASRAVLRDIIKRGGEEGTLDIDEADETSLSSAVLAAWALVHGFTLLAIDGLAQLETSLGTDELGALIGARLLHGMATA